MRTISAVDLRNDLAGIVKSLKRGERMELTYRGEIVAALTPISPGTKVPDDPVAPLKRIWARTSRDPEYRQKAERHIQEVYEARKAYGERFAE